MAPSRMPMRFVIFLSTPSARRATPMDVCPVLCNGDFYPRPPRGGRRIPDVIREQIRNFYPRPPRGGRRRFDCFRNSNKVFLSTPSARRATNGRRRTGVGTTISIHALREEGDTTWYLYYGRKLDFYPRPPRGGRQHIRRSDSQAERFLSTPSARRATKLFQIKI